MTDDRKYARIYWSVLDDPKFDGIREDVRHFGSWSIMLIVADMAWPAPAYVPSTVPRASFRALVASGLVDELVGGRFRIHGLQSERSARSNAASRAASMRWQSDSNAGALRAHSKGNAEPMPSRAEHSKAEQSSSDARFDAPETEALQWLAKHGCDIRPGNGYHQKLVTAVETHGVTALIGMMDRLASAGTKPGDVKGFLFGAIDALNAQTRPKLAELEQSDRAGQASKRAFEAAQRTKIRAHDVGYHADNGDPTCPRCIEGRKSA